MIGNIALVALGGAVGSVLRYLSVLAAARLLGAQFPWGTLLVNMLGSFAMGLCLVWLQDKGLTRLAPLLIVGVLGGFTTFSAFSAETWALWERGHFLAAGAYAAGSVIVALAGFVAGTALMREVLE